MLALVYVLWGSTSPAMKIAVATIPPFWMATARFACAGALLWIWCRARGIALPTYAEWRGAAATGIVLLVLGNATYAWTLEALPSGLGALVFALSPLWMAVFAFVLYGERIAPLGVGGLAIALGGTAYLYSPTGGQHLPAIPTAVALATSLAWGFGSVVQRRMRKSDVVQTSAMQMLAAAVVLACVAPLTGETPSFAHASAASFGALAYLVVFGSIAGFSAYLWLMNNVPTTLASTYAYVNPIVSLAIGIGFLHEPFSLGLAFGTAAILIGVALMVLAPRPRPA